MGRKRSASEARNGDKIRPKKETSNPHTLNGASQKSKKDKPAKPIFSFKPIPNWHEAELPQLPSSPDSIVVPPRHVLEEVQNHAQELLDKDNETYTTSYVSADQKIRAEFIASGTLEDKVSALTLATSESPVHNIKSLESLLGLSKKKSRNQALMALTAVKDLLVGGGNALLPADRKLRTFMKQSELLEAFRSVKHWNRGLALPEGLTEAHLVAWIYEDWLKKKYFEVLQILESWCNDEIEYTRSRSLSFVYELLRDRPEQEDNLLRLLINKLGDTSRKVASKASHLLLELQVTHPAMKSVIINAIETELLYRPGQTPHAKYYAIITLNQTILSTKDQEPANKLLSIYFALFLDLLKKPSDLKSANGPQQGGGGNPGKKAAQKAKQKAKQTEQSDKAVGELHEKMIAQVLTGVNRAFPFAKTDDAVFESQLDTIFRVTHSSNFNTSIQALMLIQQISATKHFSADRFYRTLYESLLDPRLLTSSKQILYLNLLYKSLKNDVSAKRVQAFVKRLLQIITLHEPPFITGVLYLIAELRQTFPSIKQMLTQSEDNDDDDEGERFVDAPEDGGADAPKITNQTVSANNGNPISTPKYDGRKRDPEHSNADRACIWELGPLTTHFHPSVSLFASTLLAGAAMPPKPDPTTHSLIHFLDRFAYRNAKKSEKARGSSIMQPLAGAGTADRLITQTGKPSISVNTANFWNRRAEDVAVEEVFFHQYFDKVGKKDKLDKKKAKKQQQAEEDGEGGEDEDEIWKALVDSRPEIEGPEDDEGFDEEDFDAADFDDDDEELELGDDAEMEDVEVDAEAGADEDEDELEGDDGFAGLLDDDDEAFVDSDAEVPFEVFGEEDEEGEKEEEKSVKQQRDERKKKKRKLKHLPTFASAEDYAKLLEGEEDGM